MPQHVFELGAAVLAATCVLQGLVFLIKGSEARQAAGLSTRIIRIWGGFCLLVGVGIGCAAFLVDAEQPGAHSPEHWGGVVGVAFLSVWVALMLGLFIFQQVRPPRR
jgi:uncharacterized protein YjeT (DUF2065 family)